MSSWVQSFLSSAKNWFCLSKRVCYYRFALSDVLTGFKSNEKAAKSLQKEEIEMQRLQEVEKIIGYRFNNKSLLQQAFTDPSYSEKYVSYERLEYVGDSVLNLLITKHQFFMYPEVPPGLLSPLRAANVDTEKLARVAVKHNFHKYLRHRKAVLDRRIQIFISALPKYPLHSHGLIDSPKVLADVVEAIIGAIFVDSNSSMDITWEVARGLLDPIITPAMLRTNPVTKLYQMCQKHGLKVRLVDQWSKEGAYEVFVDNKLRGRGNYRAKKEIALNRAANEAYNEILKSLGVKDNANSDG